MTDNVVSLDAARDEKDLVLQCGCGCTTFHIHADGTFECGSCGDVFNDDLTCVDYERVRELIDGPVIKRNVDHGTADIGMRRVVGAVSEDVTAAVIHIQMDGAVTSWAKSVTNEEERDWFRDRLQDAEDLLCSTGHSEKLSS